MIIISDTGPLHYLILIDETELLKEQFGRVIIPDAVLEDLQHKNTPEKVKAWIASRPVRVEVKTAASLKSTKSLGENAMTVFQNTLAAPPFNPSASIQIDSALR